MQDSNVNGRRSSSRTSSQKSSRSVRNGARPAEDPEFHARDGTEYPIPLGLGHNNDNAADENDLLKEILLSYRQGSYKAQSKENKPSSQTNSGRISPGVVSRRSISSNKSTRSNYSTASNRSRTSNHGSIASVSSRKSRTRDQRSIKGLEDELLPAEIEERKSLSSESRKSFNSIPSNRSTVTHSRNSSSSTIIAPDSQSIISEEGLNDERLRNHNRDEDRISQNNFSDTESIYSVHRSQDDDISRSGNDNRNFDGRTPSFLASSDAASVRSVPVKPPRKLSTTSEARYARKLKELDRRSGSPPSVRRSETDLHRLSKTRNSAPFQSPLSYHESIEPRTGQPELSGQKSDRQTQQKPTHSSKRSSRKSRSSYASRRSQLDSLSRLTIEEEPDSAENFESGINLHHSVSSLASGQSFYGRGSVLSKSSSGIGSPRSHSRASDGPDHRNDVDDNISIGSASSIMMRVQSRTSHTSMNQNPVAVDPDEEILVGDEKDLHDAARCGDHETVEQLLDLGTDVNCRNETDRTPLHWAAGNGHCNVIKILLEREVNIEAADKFGMSPLLWAAWFGQKECIQMLLRAGAKPNSKNKNGYTFLHCAAQNNHKMASDILSEDVQEYEKNITDDAGRTCIHILAKYGHKEMLQSMIDLECDVNVKDNAGNTPLHLGSKYGFTEVFEVLINAGANIEEKNKEHKTALHLAAEEGKLQSVEELLRLQADVNAETEEEVCPLHLAVSGGNEDIILTLLENEADIDAGNKHNQTPLHYAVVANKPTIVDILITNGADSNVQDARHETALHLAAENGYIEISEMLLHTAVDLTLKDQRGKTALDVAARGSYITIVDMILKAERHRLWMMSMTDNEQEEEQPTLYVSTSGETEEMEDVVDFPREISYKPDNTAETDHIRTLLYKLAHKYLKKGEWRRLAFQWGFTDSQVQAIEEQYIGERSYKEHGYRMLLIWLNGCVIREENPIRSLFEGLVAIQRKELAETIRTKANALPTDKNCIIS